MWELIRKHPKAVLVAILIHLFLLAFFVISVDWHHEPPAAAQPIKARAIIDENTVDDLKKNIKEPEPPEAPDKRAELEAQKKAEKEKQAELERKAQEEKARAALKKREEEAKQRQQEELKRKAQEKKHQAELKRKQEEEKKRQAELKRKEEKRKQAEQKRKAEEKRKKAEAEKRKKEAERKRRLVEEKRRKQEEALRRKEMALEEQRMQRMMAEEHAKLEQAQVAGLRSRYMGAIKSRVESRWLQPPGGASGSCEVKVKQASTGKVLDVQVLSSPSCNESMRQSVEKAVWRADPLPRAPDPRVFDREIKFIFEPQ